MWIEFIASPPWTFLLTAGAAILIDECVCNNENAYSGAQASFGLGRRHAIDSSRIAANCGLAASGKAIDRVSGRHFPQNRRLTLPSPAIVPHIHGRK
ncbi:MAG TPA: hypothetical protein PKE25_09720 [Novosphingobium sp.]|nr:hypothetical protein [Novosphingobium sp.]